MVTDENATRQIEKYIDRYEEDRHQVGIAIAKLVENVEQIKEHIKITRDNHEILTAFQSKVIAIEIKLDKIEKRNSKIFYIIFSSALSLLTAGLVKYLFELPSPGARETTQKIQGEFER